MSYCRFSSDNFRSDVYVYEHCDGGFCTHVAGNKLILPAIPDFPIMRVPRFGGHFADEHNFRSEYLYPSKAHKIAARFALSAYAFLHRIHMWSVRVIPRKNIGLPYDGEALWADDADSCADKLEELSGMGYHVPKYAIVLLREQAKDES